MKTDNRPQELLLLDLMRKPNDKNCENYFLKDFFNA